MRGIYETRQVVRLLAAPHGRFGGLNQNEIADALRISRQAVSRHLVNSRTTAGTGRGPGNPRKQEGVGDGRHKAQQRGAQGT